MASPICSLIVPVHNGLAYLRPMLESLRVCTDLSSCELILSDDASNPETLAFLESQTEARLIRSATNRGFAAACNAGAARARGEYLIFLNSDLEFRPGWLEAFLKTGREEDVGAVGTKLLYPDGTIQHGGVFLREDRLDRIPLIASHDRVGEPGDDPEANRRQSLLAVTAAALLVRQEAFESVGGFDEGYFNGYEDVDLCLKLREAGYEVIYDPAAELIHHESKSGAGRFAASKANQRRFLDRWLGRVRPEVLVDEFLGVGPHPDYQPDSPFYEKPVTIACPKVCILVRSSGNPAALAATLESVFAARIGLADRVVALVDPGDADTLRYLELCHGHDDAFEWTTGVPISRDEEYIAEVEPGILVTQGWLVRLIRHLESANIDAVGPLMTGIHGEQDALGYLAAHSPAAIHPNELTHFFARELGERSIEARAISPRCILRKASSGAAKPSGERYRIALDVFVHREARYFEMPAPALAA